MHTQCFHSSQRCREPWSWLPSWEQSALHTWLHTSCGGISWLVVHVWGKSCCFTGVSGRFLTPVLSLLSEPEHIGSVWWDRNKQGSSRQILLRPGQKIGCWPLDETPYEAKGPGFQEETQDPLFWSNFCILCRTKMIKLYQKRALCYYLSGHWCIWVGSLPGSPEFYPIQVQMLWDL